MPRQRKENDRNGAYRHLTTDYDFAEVEARWKARWAADHLYATPATPPPDAAGERRPKYYVLEYFPYPSGAGLSVGHVRNYVAGDVVARYHRMRGFDVLYPMGWDAFGLPAEIRSRQEGRHPADTTREYAGNYRRQLELVGASYDWAREVFSTDPDYYRWTQWFFLLLHRRGLAYRGTSHQWWCEPCGTVLANEQVKNGGDGPVCWRDHPGVTRREVAQWFLRITEYAERLLADLDGLDWPEGIIAMQRHWIGRGAGPEMDVPTTASAETSGAAPDERELRRGQRQEAGGEVTHRLRDWSIGRQRFWGAPIPIIHCPACGEVPVPEADLPVRLPDVVTVPPPGIDEQGCPVSPLASIPEFVNTSCPSCGAPARRETDTMDGFACSSWYFMRFTSPRFRAGPFEPAAAARWMPVDRYIERLLRVVVFSIEAKKTQITSSTLYRDRLDYRAAFSSWGHPAPSEGNGRPESLFPVFPRDSTPWRWRLLPLLRCTRHCHK